MSSETRVPKLISAARKNRRGQTLAEVLVAVAILTVLMVFITGDLTNITRVDTATDRTLEISAANFLLNVMKTDSGFWNTDWTSGPQSDCYTTLSPYNDQGPDASPSPDWHDMPTSAPAPCQPLPFEDPGAPQQFPGSSPAPVGSHIQYMWNASYHVDSTQRCIARCVDKNAADLTVWVRRDSSSPAFAYHAIRYQYPQPSGVPTISGGTPPPSSSPPPGPSPSPNPSTSPKHTPKPSPTPIGV